MAKKLNIPIVYTVHDLLPHDTGESLHDVFAEAYLIPDALICHSEEVKLALMNRYGVSSERIWTIPHGPLFHDHMMEEMHAAPKNGKVLVLWQGIIFPYKGIEFLLDSWKKVIDSGARAELLILGTGESELQKAIIAKIEALQLQDSVRLDFRFVELSALLSVYASADIVVYPYEAVTTSGALLTGLSQNKPIIATNLPYFEQVLEHGKLGKLVSYGDTESLADALLSLINSPEARTQLKTEVQSRQFGSCMWDEIARSTLACYSEVTARYHTGS